MNVNANDLRDCSLCNNFIPRDNEICFADSCKSKDLEHVNNLHRDGRKCAVYCTGFDCSTTETKGRIDNKDALKFLLAGKCEFTMVSGKTGLQLKYKMTKKKSTRPGGSEFIYYLSVEEKEPIYAGIIFFDEETNTFKFARGASGHLNPDHLAVQSIIYVLNKFQAGKIDLNLDIYHVGRCGRCGRKLTTPESILTGLGPECSRLCGVPRVKISKR